MKKRLILIFLILSTLILLFSCGTKEYTVTFDADGGSSVEAQIVKDGEKATVPTDPTKEGYTFLGWYSGNEKWSFIDSPVTENVVLKAKWEKNKYTVTFDANGGNGGTEKTVEHGKTTTAPMVTRPNYSLVGWFNGDTQWSFKNDAITDNITLVARWEGFEKTITFNANGGTVDEEERKMHYGDKIGALPVPVYGDYRFLGWYDENDTAMENPITEDYVITSKLNLVAKWEMELFTVYFNANGGTVCEESRKVAEGSAIGILPTPERGGYKFAGWYKEDDKTFETKISQRDTVTSDTVLVAWWQRDESAVSIEFDANGGVLNDNEAIKYVQKGSYAGTLPTPTKEGCTFLGWLLMDGTELRKTTVINTNTIAIAVWINAVYCLDGTENHTWSIWQEFSQATCETPQIDIRVCVLCGHSEYKVGISELGHDWSNWSNEYMKRSRTCYECLKTEVQSFKNVTIEGLGVGNYPRVEGDVWNGNNASTLINGMYETESGSLIAGKGTSPVTVTLDLENNPTVVDMIYVKGTGTASIEVTVTYEDGTAALIGVGAFGDEPSFFEVDGKAIIKVVISMRNPSNGADYWQEITLAQKA